MKAEVLKFIRNNREALPILSYYWAFIEAEKIDQEVGEASLKVFSSKHNTTEYSCHTFYKPISISIDLSFYE